MSFGEMLWKDLADKYLLAQSNAGTTTGKDAIDSVRAVVAKSFHTLTAGEEDATAADASPKNDSQYRIILKK